MPAVRHQTPTEVDCSPSKSGTTWTLRFARAALSIWCSFGELIGGRDQKIRQAPSFLFSCVRWLQSCRRRLPVIAYNLFLHSLPIPRLPGELPGTSQLKCFPWASLLHGGRSWKRQRPFKVKPHDEDDSSPLVSKGHSPHIIIPTRLGLLHTRLLDLVLRPCWTPMTCAIMQWLFLRPWGRKSRTLAFGNCRHEKKSFEWGNKKHLKNVGPIRHCEPPHAACSNFTLRFTRCRYCRTPPLSYAACASMFTTTTTTTTRDRGDRYSPIEWAQ